MRTLAVLVLLCAPAIAGDCFVRQRSVSVTSSGAVITQFAVPVAVPVGVVQYGYTYSHADAASAYIDQRELAEFRAWKSAQAQATASVQATLVSQHCAKCHAQDGDARDHYDMTGELTADMKLAAIAAVMTGEMPKSKTLDPQVRADIVAELSGVKPQGESK